MFNRNTLFVPVRSDKIRRFDLAAPASPAAIADLSLGLSIKITSVALFSNGDLCLLDAGGRLIRYTQAGSIVWNVESRAASETPFQLAIDWLDQVWVGMKGGLLSRFNSSGTLLNRVTDTDNPIVQASDATFMIAYNSETGRVVLVDVGSGTLAAELTVSGLSSQHEACETVQIGMLGTKYYLPVRRKTSATLNPGKYEILQITTAALLGVLPLQWPQVLRGTLVDAGGNIWAMDEFNAVMRFRADASLEAVYGLESQGRLNAMALSGLAEALYVISDDILGTARVHVLDPLVGVSTYVEYAGAAMTGGDLTGYQRATITADPDLDDDPPVVTVGLISALIFPTQTVITGKPGSVIKATSVASSVGTATIEADGSFAIIGANIAPATVTLTFTGPGGNTNQNVSATNHSEVVTQAIFRGTRFGLAGGRIQISLATGAGPLTTGDHYLRIKDLATGKYWNGENFVVSNGLWISLTHHDSGLWSYLFQPQQAGDYGVFFLENGVYAYDGLQVTSEPEDTAEILSQVNNMAAPGAALLAPTSLFLDEAKVGGFIAGRLARLQFLLNILAFKAQVVFPKAIEGIAAVVSMTYLKQNDTPLLLFTIMDSVTGQGKDTTDHTVRLRVRTQAGGLLIFDRELEAIDEENGQYQLRLTAADTGTAGSFQAELVDTGPDGVVLTTQNFNLVISKSLA